MENVFTPCAFGSGPPPFPPPTCAGPCPCAGVGACPGACPTTLLPPPPLCCCIGIIPAIGIVATIGIFIVGNPILFPAPAPPVMNPEFIPIPGPAEVPPPPLLLPPYFERQ